MDRMNQEWMIREGAEVFGAEGDKVGKVVVVHPSHIVVEKGFFFPSDHDIPTSAIANVDGDNVYLAVTKDQALNAEWEFAQTDYLQTAPGATTGTGYTGTDFTDTGIDSRGAGAYGTAATEPEHQTTGEFEHADEGDTIRVPVHEEELTATTRARERGAVQVAKDVVTEERVLEVPVTEERVRVTRRAVDREVGADDTAFEEGTLEVPIRGEEVALEKRTRVAEEIELAKEPVQRSEQVRGTVRKERVRVEGDQPFDETGDTSTAPS
jgi:uncharacterized protein (TIGR02271 family)